MMLEWIVSSCFLILVVLALRAALGRRIRARLRYALWALVLVRLLVPVQLFTSPVAGIRVQVSEQVRNQMERESIYVLPIDRIPAEEAEGFMISEDRQAGSTNSFGYDRLEDKGGMIVRYADKVSPSQLLKTIWKIGAVLFTLILMVSNLRFFARLRRVRKRMEETECPIPVYWVENLPSPCLFGILRPAVYMTAAAAEDPVMLRHVLAHELTHYRHLDHVWSILRGAALAVHWWNPLVWLAVLLSRRDGELACDEGALKQLGKGERLAYGETLLSLVTAKPSPRDLLSCATTMSGEKRSLRERIRWIACEPTQLVSAVIAVVVVVSVTSVCAFGRATKAEPPAVLPRQTAEPDIENHDGRTRPVLPSGRKEGIYTFLIIGSDSSGNADTLMVASYDTINQNISVMSIPRDTAVDDGGNIDTIRFIYSTSGLDALKKSVKQLIGFMPDYYVRMNQDMFVQLVDWLGGVTFNVPQDMDYDDPYQNLHIHLRKGVQTLDGEQAMGLIRFRRYKDGDIAREEVQQDFIRALIKESLSLKNWNKATEYIALACENVETDLETASIVWFASNLLGWNDGIPALSSDDVYTCTMPGDYWTVIMSNRFQCKLSAAVSFPEQVAELVNERFNPYQQEITAAMLDPVILPQEDN